MPSRVPISPPEIRQMALRSPVSVSSISMGSSWLAKVNTRSVSGPKPALCICVRLRVRPSEKVMVSWSGVYLVQMRRICRPRQEVRGRESVSRSSSNPQGRGQVDGGRGQVDGGRG